MPVRHYETAAAAASKSSFARGLFHGSFNEKQAFPYPGEIIHPILFFPSNFQVNIDEKIDEIADFLIILIILIKF